MYGNGATTGIAATLPQLGPFRLHRAQMLTESREAAVGAASHNYAAWRVGASSPPKVACFAPDSVWPERFLQRNDLRFYRSKPLDANTFSC